MDTVVRERIQTLVESAPFVVFMKGTRAAPQCGFSASVVNILDDLLEDYETFNVLEDAGIREGVKEFSDWPTIPQLFVRGKFVGGADIIREMNEAGELAAVLNATALPAPSPTLTITERAAAALSEAAAGVEEGEALRIEIDGDFNYGLFFGPKERGDVEVNAGTMIVRMPRPTARRAHGMRIDFLATKQGGGFVIDNPNEPPRVKSLQAEDLAGLFEANEQFYLIDVRTDEEFETAHIEGGKLLDANIKAEIEDLPRDAKMVFMCHHGVRSRAAAEHYLRAGFTNLWNLDGGIDAWSLRVDPAVKRY